MKRFFLVFLTVLCFFCFSCKGTPETTDELVDEIPSDEIAELPELSETEELPWWGSMGENELDELIRETPLEADYDMSFDDILADADEEEIDGGEAIEIAEEELAEDESEIAQTQGNIFDESSQIDITQPFVPEGLPQEYAPPFVQVQPPAQTPLPAPPPALLGPAEEIRPLERQSVPNIETPAATQQSPPQTAQQSASQSQQQNVPQDAPQSAQQNNGGGEITFSRVVRATVGQTIEIPFRGTGWVYLGELASRRGIAYDSRRLDSEGQSFIFKAEEPGTYALKFFRQDFIRDYILNDYVQVIVGEAPNSAGAGWFNPPVDRGRVTAEPRWPSPLEEAELQRGGSISSLGAIPSGTSAAPPSSQPSSDAQNGASAQGTPPVTQETSSAQPSTDTQAPANTSAQEPTGLPYSPGGIASLFAAPEEPPSVEPNTAPPEVVESIPPDLLLQRAKENFDAGNVSAAIALLDQYSRYYPSGTDELYWLYGQFYEANTPNRNILLSLDYYRRLTDEFPQSNYYNDARGRIVYLERFYIQIR